MITFKIPAPLGWARDKCCNIWPNQASLKRWVEDNPLVSEQLDYPIYKAQDLRDVLEQAAQLCEEVGKWPSLEPRHCSESIRAIIKEIPE